MFDKLTKERRYKLIYLLIFTALTSFAVWGGYLGGDMSMLTDENSLRLKTEDFSPNYSARRIKEDEVGCQRYTYTVSENAFKSLSGNEYKLIIIELPTT